MKNVLLVCLFLVTAMVSLRGAHIVGGDVSYICLGLDTVTNKVSYRVFFTVYRDIFSGGASFDADANFGIYRGSGNSWSWVGTRSGVNFSGLAEIDVEDNPCVEVPDNVGVEKATYTFDVNLDIIDQNYLIAYQRCCRNQTIGNLINPGDTGAAFQVEITPEAQRQCNNSPTFNSFPPIFVCAGFNIDFDHSASDFEGDELRYSFCAPKTAGGTDGSGGPGSGDAESCTGVRPNPMNCGPPFDDVVFQPPFSPTNPMGGSPQIVIDPNTGLITGVPTITGQFVVGVCVQEFRGGVLLGEIRRDFQFNVVLCQPRVLADLDAEANLDRDQFFFSSCGDSILNIVNLSVDEDFIVSYDWWFETAPGDTITFDTRDVTVPFPGIGNYTGRMILNEGTECADTADLDINIFPPIDAAFSFDYDTCVAGPIDFFDESMTGDPGGIVFWEYDFGDGNQENLPFTSYEYDVPGNKEVQLKVRDTNLCEDSTDVLIPWYPVPPFLIVEPSKFNACAPGDISFDNLSSPIDSTYDVIWDFGDGTIVNDLGPTHTYDVPGTYDVSLEVTSPIGCTISRFYSDWITVLEGPSADYTFLPEDPNVFNNEVTFTNMSMNAIGYQWLMGDEFVSLVENPIYAFQDTGVYDVQLIAFHENGCTDTLSQLLDVEPLVDYFMPNAFTPNGDGENDEFIGRGFVDGLQSFTLSIWNRWGEMVYETNDPLNGWTGTKQNSGELSPEGVYVYQLQYLGPRGNTVNQQGHVTLLR